jgi:hypothetical protein
MTQITRALQQWAQRIQALLNPDAIKHLRNPNNTGYAPCPQCGHTTTKRPDPCDPDGPPIRTPTLQWTAETGTTCTVCKASWEPRQTLFLSRLLGFELPEGVLE